MSVHERAAVAVMAVAAVVCVLMALGLWAAPAVVADLRRSHVERCEWVVDGDNRAWCVPVGDER